MQQNLSVLAATGADFNFPQCALKSYLQDVLCVHQHFKFIKSTYLSVGANGSLFHGQIVAMGVGKSDITVARGRESQKNIRRALLDQAI